jgi:hypothetical protein
MSYTFSLLPRFTSFQLNHSHEDQPTKEASQARKRLLEAFSQYDVLSKRIRKLPCEGGPGSSQDRVQIAIMTRANLFLQKNMFPLQVFSCSDISCLSFVNTAFRSPYPNPKSPLLNLPPLHPPPRLLTQTPNSRKSFNHCWSKKHYWSRSWKRQKLIGNLRMQRH